MKEITKIIITSTLLIVGIVASSHAQNVVQSLSVNLTAYDTEGGRVVKIGTPQLIRHFTGSNVFGGHLYLVTPSGNAPGAIGNLGAFLRITRGAATLLEITSPDQFNLYQDFASLKQNGANVSSQALNRFSIDSGSIRAELQGFSTWSIGPSGTGSFRSNVNGWIAVFEATSLDGVPVKGTIVAGAPRPER